MGQGDRAIRYAEEGRGRNDSEVAIAQVCEEVLLAMGKVDEAYRRYGLTAGQAGTFLGTFRGVMKKYPGRPPRQVLLDLAATTPGEEGKWFAAARHAGLLEDALVLAGKSPCDPKTLTRAALDLLQPQPAFALQAGLLALHWLVQGYGYDITGADVWAAHGATMKAAERLGQAAAIKQRIRALVAGQPSGDGFVARILGRELAVTH
jgi:hypothetical protein